MADTNTTGKTEKKPARIRMTHPQMKGEANVLQEHVAVWEDAGWTKK